MPGVFEAHQRVYAQKGVATFPVRADKRPAVKYYKKIGLKASAELASRFTDAPALAFMAGRRSGVTIVDVDSPEDAALAAALERFGDTPLLSRTGSGHWHAWYQHAGEGRCIRIMTDPPVDLLGAGMVIAPPSRTHRGDYAFVRGGLHCLDKLPTLRDTSRATPAAYPGARPPAAMIEPGTRNEALFRACMSAAPRHETCDSLFDWARDWMAKHASLPLPDDEILKTAESAWNYQLRGRNFIGAGGAARLAYQIIDDLAADAPDAFALLAILQRNHPQRAQFAMSKAHAARLGWSERRYRKARAELERRGYINCLERGGDGPGRPALFEFVKAGEVRLNE